MSMASPKYAKVLRKTDAGASELWRTTALEIDACDDQATIARLKDELALAKREIHLNRELIQVLRKENLRLQYEKHYASRTQLPSTLWTVKPKPSRRSSWIALGNDVLQVIFEFVIPPSAFLDTSSLGPTSLWCRALWMRKSLVLVCRHWRRVALPFLYREVILRRAGQVVAFSRTLQAGTWTVAPLVRSVSFTCVVPSHLKNAVIRNAAKILELCGRLSGLTLGAEFIDCCYSNLTTRFSEGGVEDALLAAFRDVGPRLRSLKHRSCNHHFLPLFNSNAFPAYFLTSFSNLRSLDLLLTVLDDSKVRLDHLEELTLWFENDEIARGSQLRILSDWHLPCLRAISLQCGCLGDITIPFWYGLSLFVRAQGAKLKSMEICLTFDPPGQYSRTSREQLNTVFSFCPSLEYISLPKDIFSVLDVHAIRRRNPEVLFDVWGEISSMSKHSNYRLLDRDLRSCPDLPRLFSRTSRVSTSDAKTTLHHVYDTHFVETPFSLFPLGSYRRHRGRQEWCSGRPEFGEDGSDVLNYAYINLKPIPSSGSVTPDTELVWDEDDTMVGTAALEESMRNLAVDHDMRSTSEDEDTEEDNVDDESDESDTSSECTPREHSDFGSDSGSDESSESTAAADQQSEDAMDEDVEMHSTTAAKELERELQALKEESCGGFECVDAEELTDEEILKIFSAGVDHVGSIAYTRRPY